MATAREVLFPKLFSTAQPTEIEKQVAKLSPGAASALLTALTPVFGNAAPLARRNDPATSKAAAAVLTASGGRESAKAKVLEALRNSSYARRNEACTSWELNKASMIQHPTVHKRLPDLRRDGLVENGPVRKCSVTGRPSLTWKAK